MAVELVVVHAGWGDHARVGQPQPPGRELRVSGRADVVERLGKVDLVRVPLRRLDPLAPGAAGRAVREHAQPGQAVAAQVHHGVVGERVDLQEPGVLPVRDERRPGAGVVERGRGQLEVLGVLVVQHVEEVARVLDAVLDAGRPRADHPELARGVVRVEDPHLAGDLAARAEHQVLLAACQPDADPVALVGLLVDEYVLLGAQRVPVDLEGAPGVVHPRVEERRPVGRPGAAVEDVGDLVGEHLAGRQVLEPEREALVALVVGREGQHRAVGADGAGADREERAVAGQLVAVEDHLLAVEPLARGDLRGRVAVGGDPAGDRVLLALLGAREIPPRALAAGHGQVGLLRAALDLLEHLLLEIGEVSGLLFEEIVLRLQIGGRVGIFLVAQPGVLVDDGVAVMDALRGNLLRHWRRVAAHVGSLCSVVIVLLPEKTAKRHEGSEALLIFRSRRGAAQPSSLTQVTLVCCVSLVGKPF